MTDTLLDAVKAGVLLADGAMGTELIRRGLESGKFGELWNLEKPEAVRSVHAAYCDAGARILTTNSFRANRHTLSAHNLQDRGRELNRAAAQLAKEAAGGRAWVMGSIGPFGDFLEPLGSTTVDQATSFFREQAEALLEGGADGIVVETMTAADEAGAAVKAARAAGAPIVIGMMTFGRAKAGFRTMMGVSPAKAVETLTEAGADIIGSNCGDSLSMPDYILLVQEIHSLTGKPVIIRPNAGRPDLVGLEVQYRQTAEGMAAEVRELIKAGANIVGGCCGTTPEHIRMFGLAI
jgi:5-methyltetrahydrofolate--homocysteine methyltransferase